MRQLFETVDELSFTGNMTNRDMVDLNFANQNNIERHFFN